MKFIILNLLFLGSVLGGGSNEEFQPYWDNFVSHSDRMVIKNAQNSLKNNPKSVRVTLSGGLGSCEDSIGDSFAFLYKYKVKVISCSIEELEISVKYWRTDPCDMELAVNDKDFYMRTPKGCNFSTAQGIVILRNESNE
jgi:hypothetical protein